MYDDVIKNEFGFYSLKTLPCDEEREAYYKEKYYQEAMTGVEIVYTPQELSCINAKHEQMLLLMRKHFASARDTNCSFLDIGCGEGFALSFFKENGFSVLGLDYSLAGAERQNPDMVNDIIQGDIYDSIKRLIGENRRFDVVYMGNVLEHVTDPLVLLRQTHSLLADGGVAVIKVPNDFSYLQEHFYNRGIIKKPHWVAPLDHISYFNREGLINICKAAGLECVDFLSDQLIELFALNSRTNYFEDKDTGKPSHLAYVEMENIFHAISPSKTVELYRVLGEMGIGRAIIGVFKREK